jgi:hypothetical protein
MARGSQKFILYLRQSGYGLFRGTVDAHVYDFFGCKNPHKAIWYHKPGSFQCAGCRDQCETDSPVGFQLFLDAL